jgi:hypothetical protein
MMTVAVARRYCNDDAVINYNRREPSIEDKTRRQVFNYLYEGCDYDEFVAKIHSYKRIGKDTYCLWEELMTLEALVDLFIIIKNETVCSSLEAFDEILETYNLDKIEEKLRCKYGKGNLVNELVDLLALRTPLTGISYMSINDDTCQVFKIYG